MEAKGERVMGTYKLTAKAMTIPAGLALGVATALAATGIGAGVGAWAILRGMISEGMIGYLAMMILLLSSAAGAAVAAGTIQRLRGQMCLAAGSGYLLSLLAVTAVFFGGQYQGMGVTALMVLCGSVLVILLAPGGKNRAGCRRRKKHT